MLLAGGLNVRVGISQQPAYLITMYHIPSESASQDLHDEGVYIALHSTIEEEYCVSCGSEASPVQLVPAAK